MYGACKALFMPPQQFMQVEDFLDHSQNFARCVGIGQMRKICECLRATVSDLSKFFMGEIAAPELKALLFGSLNRVKPVSKPIPKTVKRKRVNPNKTRTAKKKKTLEQDKAAASTGQKDDKKKSGNMGRDSGSSHVQQKKAKTTVYTSGSRPRNVHIPPQRMHQPVLTHPIINQFAHLPEHLMAPPAFGYGLPPPHLHPAYHHPHQGLLGRPQGDFLHVYPGIQLQHQGQAMFGPPAAHHPVLHGLHPYSINGAHQVQHINSRLVQRPPYGMGPGFWR
jgi:hypothetical protein